jgi:hypothetical protein
MNALRLHPAVSGGIVLFAFIREMILAINLDHEPRISAKEISCVDSERLLATEFESEPLAVAEYLPEVVFVRVAGFALVSGEFDWVEFLHD